MQGDGWQAILRELELTWHFVGPDRWHDFREVDVVVAVRGFDRHRHANKPPTKLFNAWHAGVPVILGRESAYQHERLSPLDYLEAGSFAEVVSFYQDDIKAARRGIDGNAHASCSAANDGDIPRLAAIHALTNLAQHFVPAHLLLLFGPVL